MNELPNYREELLDVLDRFPLIELKDLPPGAQMERIDRKFPLHRSRVPEVLKGLESEYELVRAGGSVVSPYETRYMDTSDLLFFRKHHRGFLSREKVRYRFYPRTETAFLEVKRKNNKGRTSKKRIPCDTMNDPLGSRELKFLEENMPDFNPHDLQPSVKITYDRVAFIHAKGEERFSLDFNIFAEMEGESTHFGEAVVIEVKQDRRYISSVISRLRDMGVREASMSKYCLTISLLDRDVKSNLFKEDLRRLKKIMHEKNE